DPTRLVGLGFTPDGREALTLANNRIVNRWDVPTGRHLGDVPWLGGDVIQGAVAGLPDGQHVVMPAADATVAVGNLTSGRVVQKLAGHNAFIYDLAVSPDGRYLATCARDGTARLWDLATGDELLYLLSLDKGKEWLAVTPDGLFDGSPTGRE